MYIKWEMHCCQWIVLAQASLFVNACILSVLFFIDWHGTTLTSDLVTIAAAVITATGCNLLPALGCVSVIRPNRYRVVGRLSSFKTNMKAGFKAIQWSLHHFDHCFHPWKYSNCHCCPKCWTMNCKCWLLPSLFIGISMTNA